MVALIGLWSHALAAVLFAALAIWQLRNWNVHPRNRPLVAAFAVTSVWAIFSALTGPHTSLTGLAESGRNFAFLAFMYGILRSAEENGRQRALKLVYASVAGVIGLQLTIAGVLPQFADRALVYQALLSTGHIIGVTIATGSLLLVHNLYGQASPESRWGIRLPMIALAGMWTYDLHLYTVAYLTREPTIDLFAMRGTVLSMLVPLFAVASKRNDQWRMQISRAATFQSLSVLAILGYLMLMMTATRALEIVGGSWVRIGQIGLISAITMIAVTLLPSGRMQAWLRVIMAKHFFEHRYDYREEWLRFTRTVSTAGDTPLGQRVVKALADISDSPGGLLFLPDVYGRLGLSTDWNWRVELAEGGGDDAAFTRFLEATSHVLDFHAVRFGRIRIDGQEITLPSRLAKIEGAWAGIPLLHNDRLVGFVVLQHPLIRRPLDWEDFDLFRTAGIQAASYLAEAHSQEALADVQRFDEFNRRFAFIMHDIKNLVSQLSLVARNAERHAHKPEFREDMIATLQSSVKKMNELLARLSRSGSADAEPPRPVSLAQVVGGIAEVKRRVHPLLVSGDAGIAAFADPARLEQALGHLVQNAIDASPPEEPVRIGYHARAGEAVIEVADKGEGMSPEFIRSRLFQPFVSTKDGGFGVGAFEARSLVAAMGGRIAVESREGQGTCFTVFLPLEATSSMPSQDRMCA